MLSKAFKSLAPKSLLARMLWIIILPMILTQTISAIVFYERHMDTVEETMLISLVNEVKFINEMYKTLNKSQLDNLTKHSSIIVKIVNKNIPLTDNIRKADMYKTLRALKKMLRRSIGEKIDVFYSFKYKQIVLAIHHNGQDLRLIFSRKKIYTPTAAIFIYWMVGSASLLLLITILFAKNQIRTITNLSIAAEKLGKGEQHIDFKPQGADEVRKAGQAFIDMQRRIENQMRQRTELLAGVSHDLKTPITRMKLQLEMLSNSEDTTELRQDIEQMESTLNDYLDFAQSEGKYRTKLVDMGALLRKIFQPCKNKFKNAELKLVPKIFANVRENQFVRAIANFINNSAKFATEIKIILTQQNEYVVIEIHDNGPGISKSERENVLRPFYRIDSSRNQNTGGIGLGLSIASDIIIRHGGELELSNSYLGGLLVIIKLPL